uniref:Uncharacterized protein n=1 Tax=Romanomermis culicivorax TaxID=13658 RepID=A0A915IC45_ROMCU
MSQYDIEPLSQENVKKSQSTPQRQFDSSQKSEIFRPHKAKSKKRYRLCSDDDDDGKNATCSKNERKQKEARKLTKETNSQNKIEVYDSSSDDEDNKKQNIEPLYYEISRYYQKLEILFKRLTNRRLKSDDPNFVKVKGRFYDRPRFVAGELKIYDNNDIDFSDYDF